MKTELSKEGFLGKNVLAFPEDMTIDQAVTQLKQKVLQSEGPNHETSYIYVTDDSGCLTGVLQVRDLLMSAGDLKLESIMKKEVTVLSEEMATHEMLEIFKKHSFLALPVIDRKKKLIGVVDVSQMPSIFEKKVEDKVYQPMGVSLEELSHRSIFNMVMLRSPWLFLSILSGLAAAFILGNYFLGIESIISLILFIPIVLGLSGSMARQCAALVTQQLTRGRASLGAILRILVKETSLAVFAGALTLVCIGVMAVFLKKSLVIALAISLAITLAIFLSGVLGAFFPFIFVGLRLDPKIATGPFAVALCDLFALWAYLQVAFFFLSRYLKVG